MPIYLVTGGAGFIGSHLVRQLVRSGQRVRVFDNYATGKINNLHDVAHNIELVEGDLRDYQAVLRAVKGTEVIFHVGAIPSVPKSIRDPETSDRVNTAGTLNVLQAAVNSGARRVIYSASSSVYGNTNTVPKTEQMVADPMSPYAISKYSGELYCRVFHQIYGLETVSLRYFNVFGPRQDPDSEYAAVIPKFIRAMSLGKQPVIFGDGSQSRDFTYIDNVIRANLLAAHAPRLQGESVNIGCGERVTLNQLVEMIKDVLKTDISPIYAAPRQGDVLHSLAAIQAAQTLLGYMPSISLREGLERTIRWFKEEEEWK